MAYTRDDIPSLFNKEEYRNVQPSQYALLLGSDPIRCKRRAKIASDFFQVGGAKKIILSGGVKHVFHGEEKKECEILRSFLLEYGVSEDVLLEEDQSTDTITNMIDSLQVIAKDKYLLDVKSVTIITEPFHLPRAMLLADSFLPSYFTIHGYTENIEEQMKEESELFEKEIEYINDVIKRTKGRKDHV